MRLTVGPLPPAVYWRRRAVVLGTLLATVFLLIYSCGGTTSGAKDNEAGRSTPATPGSPSSRPLTPAVTGGSTSAAPASPSSAASVGPDSGPDSGPDIGPNAGGEQTGQPTGSCTDAELGITVATDGNKTEYPAGTFVRIYLKIKNVSTRSCSRDVGATQQELRIAQGATKMWSSDDCAAAGGSAIRNLAPGEEFDVADVMWNGRASTNCQNRPVPEPGTYQLTGRVGTKWSDPVTLTVKPVQGK
jgi:hypothetical protein